jgi:hypothetical protein
MWRRITKGLGLSVAIHLVAVGAVVGWTFLEGASSSHVDVDIVHVDLNDLPLGAPTAGEKAASAAARAQAPAVVAKTGTLPSKDEKRPPRPGTDGDDETPSGATPARPTSLKELGPGGARFTMLLRVDRLHGTPFEAPVDALLMRMPDRRDLFEGTGLDLYEDFDALLVSTPNLMDYTATFLAARHHLIDGALRAAIDRGAKATDRVVSWRTERRRPWGERKLREGATRPPGLSERDERLIVLPATGLVVITPPAYRALLLARPAPPPDAGAPDDGGADGAAPDGGVAPAAPSWTSLLRRIDAEDGLMPANGVALVTAVDLFHAQPGRPLVFLGVPLEVPRLIEAVIGNDIDDPSTAVFVDIKAELADEPSAAKLEASLVELQKKLRTNPYVLLGGFGRVLMRVTSSRDGNVVRLRATATSEETLRLLQVVTTALGG